MPHPTFRHARISKACQACRQKKVKCDGKTPCRQCQRLSVECQYRSRYRKRRVAQSQPTDAQVLPTPTGQSKETSPPSPVPLVTRLHYSQNQAATVESDSAPSIPSLPPPSPLQYYYGASSNFAFLQQIHHSLSVGGVQAASVEPEANDRGLFLGQQNLSQNSRLSEQYVQSRFLPYELASDFLERYLTTLHHLHPIQSPSHLRALCSALYSISPNPTISTEDSALIMTIISIGATMTEHLQWSEVLIEKVKRLLVSYEDALYAHYYLIMGKPNTAYLQLGIAVRKAFSAGLHRLVPKARSNSYTSEQIQERRTTIWCIYFYDSLICFSLGRPKAMSLDDITTPFPDGRPIIPAIVRFLTIASNSARRIYGSQRSSLLDMWAAAQEVHRELSEFSSTIQDQLGFNITGTIQDSRPEADQVFLTTLYHQTIILTFRPFLIVHFTWQQQLRKGNHQVASISTNTECLLDGCKSAVTAAIGYIDFISEVLASEPIMKTLRFFSFYIEGACMLLIYDILRYQRYISSNINAIRKGMQCLSELIADQTTTSVILEITRLLDAIVQAYPQRTSNVEQDSLSNIQNNVGPGLPASMAMTGEPRRDNTLQDTSPLQDGRDTRSGEDFMGGVVSSLNQNPLFDLENLGFDPANTDWEFDVFASDFGNCIFEGGVVGFHLL